MVSAAIIGYRGMLGSVVARRWQELGVEVIGIGRGGELPGTNYVVNCIRPDNLDLSRALTDYRLIQPSTDAIAEPTYYAEGKRALEKLDAITLRSGLVDITRQPASAYLNWWCNPLTPLEWADMAWELRDGPGVHPLGRERVSRYQVAVMVSEVFGTERPTEAAAEEPLDRVVPCRRRFPVLRVALEEYERWLSL